ncbi:hypothetical protein BKA61DRAFT_284737 [Leptodontidium sp. MPI-SDFR-AT-0119]|nr:hypothetical protein BKA61DRAFT_284737 [Leptodontidium sp. MPI-SDFR-AT-0119]
MKKALRNATCEPLHTGSLGCKTFLQLLLLDFGISTAAHYPSPFMAPKLFHAQAVGLIVCFLVSNGLAGPLHSKRFTNIRISAPNGTQTHNDPKQICKPPKFFDYLAFYFGNYFAHIATVQTYPGESGWSTIKAYTCPSFPCVGHFEGVNGHRPVRNPTEDTPAESCSIRSSVHGCKIRRMDSTTWVLYKRVDAGTTNGF